MSTGLFIHRTRDARAIARNGVWKMPESRRRADAAKRAKGERTKAAFADALSEHGDVKRAAAEVGVCEDWGRVLLHKICRDLGWQAR